MTGACAYASDPDPRSPSFGRRAPEVRRQSSFADRRPQEFSLHHLGVRNCSPEGHTAVGADRSVRQHGLQQADIDRELNVETLIYDYAAQVRRVDPTPRPGTTPIRDGCSRRLDAPGAPGPRASLFAARLGHPTKERGNADLLYRDQSARVAAPPGAACFPAPVQGPGCGRVRLIALRWASSWSTSRSAVTRDGSSATGSSATGSSVFLAISPNGSPVRPVMGTSPKTTSIGTIWP